MGRFRLGEGEPKLGYGSMCMTKKHRRKHDDTVRYQKLDPRGLKLIQGLYRQFDTKGVLN